MVDVIAVGAKDGITEGVQDFGPSDDGISVAFVEYSYIVTNLSKTFTYIINYLKK